MVGIIPAAASASASSCVRLLLVVIAPTSTEENDEVEASFAVPAPSVMRSTRWGGGTLLPGIKGEEERWEGTHEEEVVCGEGGREEEEKEEREKDACDGREDENEMPLRLGRCLGSSMEGGQGEK